MSITNPIVKALQLQKAVQISGNLYVWEGWRFFLPCFLVLQGIGGAGFQAKPGFILEKWNLHASSIHL